MSSHGFKLATPIQNMTIEPILLGKDIFAQAETGSGKTGAFAIPILERIMRDEATGDIAADESRYVILSPTRELAQQTHTVFEMFGKELGITSCCVIGGESIDKQKELIGKGIHVLIGTPGRVTDLIKQKTIKLKNCKGVVFDEADRLFDMGFKKDIEFILGATNKDRQLIMVSATSNQDVLQTAYKFHSEPEELKLNEDSLLVDHIDHKLAMVTREEKFPLLVSLLRKKEDAYAIVFCNTQFQTHQVAEWLNLMDFKAKPISGRMAQNKRTRLMDDFRAKKISILVCTDVAARGLDIKNVNLVINFDLPQEASNYVHRIGRTGRAGQIGEAISFCAHEDCEYIDPIYELIEAKIEKLALKDDDFATDICKRPYIDSKTLKVTERTLKHKKEYDKPKRKKVETTTPYKKVERAQRPASEPQRPRVDKRFFKITSYDLKGSIKSAAKFFNIDDYSLIGHDVTKEGKRRFVLFGAKKNEYKFFIKPIYKKILLPYLIPMVKKANLELYVKVSFKPNTLYIHFSGKDEALLKENQFELLNSFEHLIKTYLQSRIVMHSGLKIQVSTSGKKIETQTNKKNRNDDKAILALAKKMKDKVLADGKPVKLKPLNGAERRLIHQFFQDESGFKTSSLGDGRLKTIEISKT